MTMLFMVLLALIVGSFISALTYRLPRKEGFVKGRSYCDSCKQGLHWYHNIPVFSFLLLGGKSACCGQKISIRYPLIELASAFGAVIIYSLFPFPLFAIGYTLFAICLAIFVIDLEQQIIPDEFSLLVFLLGLFAIRYSLFASLFAGFFCALILLIIHLITKGRGMGLGDVKLAIALGIWLGWLSSLKWLMISFILGGLVSAILLLLKKANLKTKIAFGPFLIVGFWLILLYEKFF